MMATVQTREEGAINTKPIYQIPRGWHFLRGMQAMNTFALHSCIVDEQLLALVAFHIVIQSTVLTGIN